MRKGACVVVAGLVSVSSWASEPGQPQDCSDWVFLEPGFSCEVFVPYPCESGDLFCNRIEWERFPTDNESFFFYQFRNVPDVAGTCPQTGGVLWDRVELVRTDEFRRETVIGYMVDRCDAVGDVDKAETCTSNDAPQPPCLFFDSPSGRMLVKTAHQGRNYPPGTQVFAIRGFAPLLEIFQSFDPQPSTLGFTVPAMPEGFAAVDYFDTYWGHLATVGDWSQAKPLKCGYPASPPMVGDYLTVEDTLPAPARGSGYYYVTAAHYQGQTRYGRKSSGGRLTGRDSAALPPCE